MAGKETLTAKEKRGMELFCRGIMNLVSGQLGAEGLTLMEAPTSQIRSGDTTTDLEKESLLPMLRNLTLTAPYMHDGRFKTLEEVVAHYSGPLKRKKTLDPNLSKHPRLGLQLSHKDQAGDRVSF